MTRIDIATGGERTEGGCMDAREVLASLAALAAERCEAARDARLAALLADPVGRRVLRWTYDGRHSFGIARKTLDAIGWQGGAASFALGAGCRVEGTLRDLSCRRLSGLAARVRLEALSGWLDAPSLDLLRRILLGDARAGVTARMINRVRPGTLFEVAPMLAESYRSGRIDDWSGWIAEPKLDGVRALAVADPGGTLRFLSRAGTPFAALAHLAEPLAAALAGAGLDPRSVVVDGEVVSRAGGFADIAGAVRRKQAPARDAVFHVFDIVDTAVFEDDESPDYRTRRALIERAFAARGADSPIRVVPCHRVRDEDDMRALYDRLRAAGAEGLMLKPRDHIYECGRSPSWLKVKAEQSVDAIITGFFEGSGKYRGMLGGVHIDVNGVRVSVGGGSSDQQRRDVWRHRSRYAGRMIEVLYQHVTPDGSLRHPRFRRFRDDKHDRRQAAA